MNEIESQEDEVRIAKHNVWVAKTNLEDYEEQLINEKRKLIKLKGGYEIEYTRN